MSKATDAMRRVNLKHGEALVGRPTPEYRIWAGMKGRCLNKKSPRFSDYGGRGIGICTKWLEFENFLRDVGRRPSPAHSLDRIDNNKSYVPGNVRWATKQEQARNRRSRPLTIDGVTKLLCEWSDESGVALRLIWQRLYVLHWLPAKAVYTPSCQLVPITHCKRGHPLSGKNMRRNQQGGRVCRTCCQAARRARRAA